MGRAMRTFLVAALLLAAVLSAASAEASSPGYGCEPTPHGVRCTGDLVVCTVYSGSESSGLGYSGFDCGAVSCDVVTYQGRVKDHDCSVATAATAAGAVSAGDPREHLPDVGPLPAECIDGIGSSWCSVDAGVCQFRQTRYHFEERSETELRCLGVVECTWGSGGASAFRAGSEPFCPVPL